MSAKPDKPSLPRLPMPDWLFNEQISTESRALRDEWAAAAADDRADPGLRRVATAMLRMRSQRPTQPLLARANSRALRFVDSALRRSRMCRQLQQTTPGLPWRTRLALTGGRFALATAACLVLLLCKTGVFSTFDSVSRTADRMAKAHVDRHIGPLT